MISNAADHISFGNAGVYSPAVTTYSNNAASYTPVAETVVINEPAFANDFATFDNTPVFTNDFAAFDNAQAFANANNGQIVAAGPFVATPQFDANPQFVATPQFVSTPQFVPQQVAAISYDNVDEYGAPQASLLG